MTSLFHGVIYNKNIPVYDIILKSDNIKLSLWYLIRLYYEKNRNDIFESFLLNKLKQSLVEKKNFNFQFNYAQFSIDNRPLISTITFMLSNDIINLSNIFFWVEEFNSFYPTHSIIVKKRLVFDTTTRMFTEDFQIDSRNYIYNSLQLKSNINNNNNTLKNKTTQIPIFQKNKYQNDISIKLDRFIPKYDNNSIIDNFNKWSYSKRFNKYKLNSLLLLDYPKK